MAVPSYPSLAAVSGAVDRIDGKVDTLESQTLGIKLELGLLTQEVAANRDRAEERHSTLLGRFDRLDEHSGQGALPSLRPRLFGLAPGTGREIAIVLGAFAVIAASYLGGQSGSTATTEEVVQQVEAAVHGTPAAQEAPASSQETP